MLDSFGGSNAAAATTTMKKALREMQTLRAAYAGALRPPSLYRIWSGLLNSFKSH